MLCVIPTKEVRTLSKQFGTKCMYDFGIKFQNDSFCFVNHSVALHNSNLFIQLYGSEPLGTRAAGEDSSQSSWNRDGLLQQRTVKTNVGESLLYCNGFTYHLKHLFVCQSSPVPLQDIPTQSFCRMFLHFLMF